MGYQSARIVFDTVENAKSAVKVCDNVLCRYLNNVLKLRFLKEEEAIVEELEEKPDESKSSEIVEINDEKTSDGPKSGEWKGSGKTVAVLGFPSKVMRTRVRVRGKKRTDDKFVQLLQINE